MRKVFYIFVVLFGLVLWPTRSYAQEDLPEIDLEPSAEVFLEDYSDEFQEKFFEALKQKGIENYDRAVNLLLECKRIDTDNSVVDHELAKAYFEDEQFISAQDYALGAVLAEPGNLWYLSTLVSILQKQGRNIDDVSSKIPIDDPKLKENLALIYFKSGRYENALGILKSMQSSSFAKDLSAKINDSIENQKQEVEVQSFTTTNEDVSDAMQDYKMRLEGFIRSNSIPLLEMVSAEALENYPLQPFFYYARGYALNKKAKHREAIEVLEAAFDYLLDDFALANKIYKELADAHTALNNTSKANMYLRKIKPGF